MKQRYERLKKCRGTLAGNPQEGSDGEASGDARPASKEATTVDAQQRVPAAPERPASKEAKSVDAQQRVPAAPERSEESGEAATEDEQQARKPNQWMPSKGFLQPQSGLKKAVRRQLKMSSKQGSQISGCPAKGSCSPRAV